MTWDKWNDRRLELVDKQKKESLTTRERQELSLMERCFKYQMEGAPLSIPKTGTEVLKMLVTKLRNMGYNI